MTYGLPYKGSKNKIAQWVVDTLPGGECLVDLFGGGGAITHAAILSGKYNSIIYNDIAPGLSEFLKECMEGKHTRANHKEFITRDEFFARKDTDWYVKLCWSFGTGGTSYAYSRTIEDWKHALWDIRQNNDHALMHKMGILTDGTNEDIKNNYTEYAQKYADYSKSKIQHKHSMLELESVERLSRIEQLGLRNAQQVQSMQNLDRLDRLGSIDSVKDLDVQFYNMSYQDVKIQDGYIIYCDIPYHNTKCDMYNGFDHEAFYEWARQQDNIYISEYTMPADFVEIARIQKTVTASSYDNSSVATEKIFTNQRTYEKIMNRGD